MQRKSALRPSCRNVYAAASITSGSLPPFAAIGTNARTSSIPPHAPQKMNMLSSPRPTSRDGKLDGGVVVGVSPVVPLLTAQYAPHSQRDVLR
jgi:hypothetical protein